MIKNLECQLYWEGLYSLITILELTVCACVRQSFLYITSLDIRKEYGTMNVMYRTSEWPTPTNTRAINQIIPIFFRLIARSHILIYPLWLFDVGASPGQVFLYWNIFSLPFVSAL